LEEIRRESRTTVAAPDRTLPINALQIGDDDFLEIASELYASLYEGLTSSDPEQQQLAMNKLSETSD
jgi:hypothetical protein